MVPNGMGYCFCGNGYARYRVAQPKGVDTGYPRYIDLNWPRVWDRDIDAVVLWPNGKAYFFKGTEYVRYTPAPSPLEGVDPGYPKPIKGHWPGLAEVFGGGVDAAVVLPAARAASFKA